MVGLEYQDNPDFTGKNHNPHCMLYSGSCYYTKRLKRVHVDCRWYDVDIVWTCGPIKQILNILITASTRYIFTPSMHSRFQKDESNVVVAFMWSFIINFTVIPSSNWDACQHCNVWFFNMFVQVFGKSMSRESSTFVPLHRSTGCSWS